MEEPAVMDELVMEEPAVMDESVRGEPVLEEVRILDFPFGRLILKSDGEAITYLGFDDNDAEAGNSATQPVHGIAADERVVLIQNGGSPEHEDSTVMQQAIEWLQVYFSREDPGPLPPLRPKGTDFQQRVWDKLREIPYGTLTTYGAIARDLSRFTPSGKMSSRAVGSAIGRNPISIFIPCHRVIGSGGNLTGYAWGIDRKLALLQLEGIDTASLKRPHA